MSDLNEPNETIFACNISALTPDQLEHHKISSSKLFAAVLEVQETSMGYKFRFTEDSTVLPELADFITYDRLCCPFFVFGIEVEPHGGSIWLHISGVEGVKLFIVSEVSDLLTDEVANAASFKQSIS